jgi:hypothetical protein
MKVEEQSFLVLRKPHGAQELRLVHDLHMLNHLHLENDLIFDEQTKPKHRAHALGLEKQREEKSQSRRASESG